MYALRVQYTVTPDYAATNVAHIARVMAALQSEPINGVQYSVFCKADGCTFVHLVVAESEAARNKIPGLPEFQAFQAALQASGPVAPPATEELEVVGMSRGL